MDHLFETASREKYRFPFKGQVSVEDLWDLSPKDLDTIFKSLNAQVKKESEESLLSPKEAVDVVLNAKIEIVKHIVAVKLSEAEKARQAKKRREEKQRIAELIADKQDEALREKSLAELQAMLNAMD